MTAVNWERMSGDDVEQLVAALILQSQPNGNRVTPSRGDRGIDFRIWNGSAWEVYQVKRYCKPLTAKQAKDVEHSWNTFVHEVLGVLPVEVWHLVMPWDPTTERLKWFDELTVDQGIGTAWIGRTQLDVLAADHPRIVDYFLGDGAGRIRELITAALTASSPAPDGASGQDLLDAVVSRQQALAVTLDEVDPFYRYEVDVRAGALSESWSEQLRPGDDEAAMTIYEQVSEDRHVAIRVFPRTAYSAVLRPITHTLNLDVSDPTNRERVQNFQRYGAPFDRVPAMTIRSSGPPGTTVPPDTPGLVTFAVASGDDIPDLELRLLDSTGETMRSVPLVDVEVSRGMDQVGMRIAGWDPSRSLRVEARMASSGTSDSLHIETVSMAGKPVRKVQVAVELIAAIDTGCSFAIAIDGGLPVGGMWSVDSYPSENRRIWVKLIRDLVEIQAHTHSVIAVPAELTGTDANEIGRVAALLRGAVLPIIETRVGLIVTAAEAPRVEQVAVRFHRRMALELEGREIELDRLELVYSPRAHLESATNGDEDHASVVFDEQATVRAWPIALGDLSDIRPGQEPA